MGLRTRPTPVDLVVAAALTLATQAEIWAPGMVPGAPEPTGHLIGLALSTLPMTLALAARRVAPLPVLALALGVTAGQQLLTEPTEGLSTLITMLLACHAAGAHASPRQAAAGGMLIALAAPLIGEDLADHLFVAVVLGASWLTGLLVGRRSEQVHHLTRRNRDLSRQLAEAATALAAATSAVPAPATRVAGLTPRELEVTRAMAAGMSNADIARHLMISEWTVKTHVASVLRKLQLRDRAQVVVAAYEAGIVTPGGLRS